MDQSRRSGIAYPTDHQQADLGRYFLHIRLRLDGPWHFWQRSENGMLERDLSFLFRTDEYGDKIAKPSR